MKTSNRLLLGMMAVIVFYVTAAFIELRIKGDYNRGGLAIESKSVPDFRHIVIDEVEAYVNIQFSDTSAIGLVGNKSQNLESFLANNCTIAIS